jgi:hypothetical protein
VLFAVFFAYLAGQVSSATAHATNPDVGWSSETE